MDISESENTQNNKNSVNSTSASEDQKEEASKTPRTLSKIPEIVRRLTDPTEGIKLTEKKSLLKVHRNCFTGSELIDWFINKRYVVNRTTGVALGGILMKEGVIYCASPKDGPFKDGDNIYKFNKEKNLSHFQDQSKFRRIDTHHLLNEQRYSLYANNKPETDPSNNTNMDKVARCLKIQEIIDTEKFYLKSLDIAIEKYMKPLQRSQLISEKKIKNIFNNIEDILETSQFFLKILLRDIPKGFDESVCIGKCFLELIPRLDVYALYARNHQKCIKQMIKFEHQKPSFIQHLNQIREKEDIHDLMSLLIQPVQRIPHYKLLIEDLLRKTPETHPDNKNLKIAQQRIEEIANNINESIRKYENLQKLNQIVKLFGNSKELDELIVETRTVIKEGILTKVGRKAHMERYFVLLNDLLLYGAKALNGNHYTLNRILYMDKTLVKDVADSADVTNGFLILSVGKSFIVYAATADEKKAWMTEFSKLQRTDTNIDVAPVWMGDGESDKCLKCSRQFTTLFRRHHCRNCGLLVCNKCSSRRAVVTKVDPTKMSRVCDDCFKKLTTIDPETVEQIDLDEYDEKADYSKLQEGVVRGIVKGTPSKVDKVLGMKSPSPLKYARKSNMVYGTDKGQKSEENLNVAQELEQMTFVTPPSRGWVSPVNPTSRTVNLSNHRRSAMITQPQLTSVTPTPTPTPTPNTNTNTTPTPTPISTTLTFAITPSGGWTVVQPSHKSETSTSKKHSSLNLINTHTSHTTNNNNTKGGMSLSDSQTNLSRRQIFVVSNQSSHPKSPTNLSNNNNNTNKSNNSNNSNNNNVSSGEVPEWRHF